MLVVQRMTPLYTERSESQLRLVFADEYITIMKEDEIFHFIRSEGNEILINMKSMQVENLSEVFIFQKEERFIRLPLYQLLLFSDLQMHLQTIIKKGEIDMDVKIEVSDDVIQTAQEIIKESEYRNCLRMIDYALETKNLSLFKKLTEAIKEKDEMLK